MAFCEPIEQLFLQICAQRRKRHKRFVAAALMFRDNGHFFHNDGRSCFPSDFDAQYYYAPEPSPPRCCSGQGETERTGLTTTIWPASAPCYIDTDDGSEPDGEPALLS